MLKALSSPFALVEVPSLMRLLMRSPVKEEKRGVSGGRSSPPSAHLQDLDPYLKDSLTNTRMTGGHCGQALISAQAKSS